jgi:hypothetical protein
MHPMSLTSPMPLVQYRSVNASWGALQGRVGTNWASVLIPRLSTAASGHSEGPVLTDTRMRDHTTIQVSFHL